MKEETLALTDMNKATLAEVLAERTGIQKKLAEDIVEAFADIITEALQRGDEVTIAGFGTFSAKFRHARNGVNPQNPSEPMQIPAVTVPKFKAGKNLKEALKHTGKASEAGSTGNSSASAA
jgi:DNA-binding protein HU-beta